MRNEIKLHTLRLKLIHHRMHQAWPHIYKYTVPRMVRLKHNITGRTAMFEKNNLELEQSWYFTFIIVYREYVLIKITLVTAYGLSLLLCHLLTTTVKFIVTN